LVSNTLSSIHRFTVTVLFVSADAGLVAEANTGVLKLVSIL